MNITKTYKRSTPSFGLFFIVALAMMIGLSGCAGKRTVLDDPRFRGWPVINVDTASKAVEDDFKSVYGAPYVEFFLNPSLGQGVRNWADDRVKPVGKAGVLRLRILEAAVVREQYPVRGTFWSYFTIDPADQYTALLEVRIEGDTPHRLNSGSATVRVRRTATLSEGVSDKARRRALQALVSSTLQDFNREAEKAIRNNLAKIVL